MKINWSTLSERLLFGGFFVFTGFIAVGWSIRLWDEFKEVLPIVFVILTWVYIVLTIYSINKSYE